MPGVQQVGKARRVEAGGDDVACRRAADLGGLLEHQHTASRLGQQAGGGQTVVAGADYDDVMATHAALSP